MPNWIKNKLTVHGNKEQLDAMQALVTNDETTFDLNRVVPMPRDLDIDSGTTSKNAMALFDDSEALFMLSFPWVADAGSVKAASGRAVFPSRLPGHLRRP